MLKYTQDYKIIAKNAKENSYALNQNDALDLLVILLSWNSHMKDMYTLARVLYYVVHGNDNIISYDGNQHTLRYVEFFKKYMRNHAMLIYQESIIDKRKALSDPDLL